MTRILIVAPAWIGDMVMAQSLVAALQRREPEATIDLLAPPWTAGLGRRMPGVARTIEIAAAHGRFDAAMRFRLGRTLRANHHDLAIVLPSSWKSAIVPFVAGIKRRRGYVGEFRLGMLNDSRRLDEARMARTIDRFVALAAGRGEAVPESANPVLTADPERAHALAEKLGVGDDRRPAIALCPGAEFGPAKRWPAAHFAALAEILDRRGYQAWIFGSPGDVETGETIRALVAARGRTPPVNLAGQTSLLDAIDLLSRVAGVVTNDSGLMHIAAAIGRPLVALYGSSTPVMTPPMATDVRIAERTLPCRPCFQRVCPLGHLNCLNLITAAEVAEMLDDVLKARAAGPVGRPQDAHRLAAPSAP